MQGSQQKDLLKKAYQVFSNLKRTELKQSFPGMPEAEIKS